jgi:outer membrane protein TolC
MKKLFSLLFVVMMFASQLFATEQFTLQTAKERVANENMNISIAYEQYIQAKNEARAKTMQLLPRLNVDLLINDYSYNILRSVIPEPQRFFEAAAQKDLAKAAEVNKLIVTANLLEDLEKTYFLLQFHKEIDESLAKELAIRTEIADRSKESYEFGSIFFEEFYNTQRDVVSARIQSVNSSLVVKSEEFALKLILQVEDNLAPLELAIADFYNGALDFPVEAQIGMDVAANNSKEVDQHDYLVLAARNVRRGVGISWISWGGVGFDYFARCSVANSEIKKIEMLKSKAIFEVKNQVAAMYEEIAKHKEKMELQDKLLAMAKTQYATTVTNRDNLLTTVIAVKKAELSLLGAQRDSRRLEYELELKYIKLKRLMSADMLTNEIPKA